ncbi:MAG TPA: hypothetical protein VFQ05_04380 [Candidatus Eisenbacteria bacterium]|nr:hypothetical protein [Candidatus Eisenbacteria bacterium]
MSDRAWRLSLLTITAIGAFLRLGWPGSAPPGLNQDEAIGAWISWCLLGTGRDMNGQPWPVFYSRGIGDYPSTLFFYVTMPFQAIGGLNVTTTRLPAGLAGIACVPLIAWIGARLLGRGAGLTAAAMLALNPWHLFLSRFGVGASQCPLHALAVVALMIKAGLLLEDSTIEKPRAGRIVAKREPDARWAALAGIVAGVSCYGFHAMRLYFPVLFLGLALFLLPQWLRLWSTARGRAALIALMAGFAIPIAPLAILHLNDSPIAHRWEMTRLWPAGAPLTTIVAMVLKRWAEHFHPDFLFVRGDLFESMRLWQGAFGWHMLPLMLAGIALVATRFRQSPAARVMLALLVAYPAGDVISRYASVHTLRAAPGVGALVLLAAWGAGAIGGWVARHRRALVPYAAATLVLAGLFFDGRFILRFFGEWNRRPEIYHTYHVDLLDVARWLKPRLARADAVFCTVKGLNQPWSVLAVGTEHSSALWLAEPRDVRPAEYDVVVRYGKMHFLYADFWVPYLNQITGNGKPDHVFFIVRPGELRLTDPIHTVRGPDGREVLWVVARTL